MPTIEELQQFKRSLDQLQGEPDYASAKGWVIEDVSPPSADEVLIPRVEDYIRPSPFDQEPEEEKKEDADSAQSDEWGDDGVGSGGLLDWGLEDGSLNEQPPAEDAEAFSSAEDESGNDEATNLGDAFFENGFGEQDTSEDASGIDGNGFLDADQFGEIPADGEPVGDDEFGQIPADGDPVGDDEFGQIPPAEDFVNEDEFGEIPPPEELAGPLSDDGDDEQDLTELPGDTPSEEQLFGGGESSNDDEEVGADEGPEEELDEVGSDRSGDDATIEEGGELDGVPETLPPDEDEVQNEEGGDAAVFKAGQPGAPTFDVSDRIAELEAQLEQLGGVEEEDSPHDDESEFRGTYIPLTPQHREQLDRNLRNFPLNLRIAVEKDIGSGNLAPEAVDEIIGLIIKGCSPRHLANRFFELSGKKVLLPHSVVMRLSLEELERRHQTFGYQFAQLAWPRLRIYLLSLLALAMLVLGVFHLLYRPLLASRYYRQGEKAIFLDRYKEAEKLFDRASYGWRVAGLDVLGEVSAKWYLRYASAYTQRYNFVDAEAKYRALLEYLPNEKLGWLNYGAMLLYDVHEYPRAVELMKTYQSRFGRDQRSLLLLAGAYLAMSGDQPALLHEAEKNYAAVLSTEGSESDQAAVDMLKFLLFKMRRDPGQGAKQAVFQLASGLLDEENVQARGAAAALSEAARFMVDQQQFKFAHSLLRKATELDRSDIDTYLQYSYYYRQMNEPSRERQALHAVLYFLGSQSNDSLRQLQRLYAYQRLAQLSLRVNQEESVRWFGRALQAADYAKQRFFPHASQALGELYGDVGDLLFENYHFDSSRSYYESAKAVNYRVARVNFRLGYTYYRNGQWQQAADHFYSAQQKTSSNPSVDYALANSLFMLQNWQSAAGLYAHVNSTLDRLLDRLPADALRRLPRRELLKMKMKSLNNESAALYSNFLQTSNQQNLVQAMNVLEQSINILDAISRDPELQLKLDEKLLEGETLLPLHELEKLEKDPERMDPVRNSIPRRNFFVLLHPDQRQQVESFPLSSAEVLRADVE